MNATEKRLQRVEQKVMQSQGRCFLWIPDAEDAEAMKEFSRKQADAVARGEQVFVFRWQE
jgi:hypothetical protein